LETEISSAVDLLSEEENSLPDNVKNIIIYCTNHNVGYLLSRNKYAGTCRDARNKRNRLGHIGIPLYDELKTIVAQTINQQGQSIFVAMHCRGHMEIDFKSVQRHLGFSNEISILSETLLEEKFGLKFGIINPISLSINSKSALIQIFDIGVLKPVSKYPGTMMTNAGDHYWGIEFDVKQVIESLNSYLIKSISIQDKELSNRDLPQCTNPKSIGIITGNGPDSGIALWSGINNSIASILGDHFLGDMSLPEVHIVSLPAMGLSMELDKREYSTWNVLHQAVETLKLQNVELLALACHTTHYFENKIRKCFDSSNRKFISMPQTVLEYLIQAKVSDAAILGIHYVADLSEWSAYAPLEESGIIIEKLDPEIVKRFHAIGYEVKQMVNHHKSFQQFIALLKNVTSKNIIIALTELSILLENSSKKARQSDKNVIDALYLYAQAIAYASLGLNPSYKEDIKNDD